MPAIEKWITFAVRCGTARPEYASNVSGNGTIPITARSIRATRSSSATMFAVSTDCRRFTRKAPEMSERSKDVTHTPTGFGPCVICGDINYGLSCGGPTICPKCDCGHFDAATVEMQARSIASLKARIPFRNVDDLDWKHMLSFIPDSGHGRFWKAVFAELRTALTPLQQRMNSGGGDEGTRL